MLPVFVFAGKVVDGAKREQICAELGRFIATKHLHSLTEACSTLWALGHPDRALALAGPETALLELASLCSAPVSAVAQLLQLTRPRTRGRAGALAPHRSNGAELASNPRAPRKTRGQKSRLLQVWLEPQLHHWACKLAEAEGVNLSEAARRAIWHKIALTVPRAPLQRPKSIRSRPRRAAG